DVAQVSFLFGSQTDYINLLGRDGRPEDIAELDPEASWRQRDLHHPREPFVLGESCAEQGCYQHVTGRAESTVEVSNPHISIQLPGALGRLSSRAGRSIRTWD